MLRAQPPPPAPDHRGQKKRKKAADQDSNPGLADSETCTLGSHMMPGQFYGLRGKGVLRVVSSFYKCRHRSSETRRYLLRATQHVSDGAKAQCWGLSFTHHGASLLVRQISDQAISSFKTWLVPSAWPTGACRAVPAFGKGSEILVLAVVEISTLSPRLYQGLGVACASWLPWGRVPGPGQSVVSERCHL